MLRSSHMPALFEALEVHKFEYLNLESNQFGTDDGTWALARGLATNTTLISLT